MSEKRKRSKRGRTAGKAPSMNSPEDTFMDHIDRSEFGEFSGKMGTALVHQVLIWYDRIQKENGGNLKWKDIDDVSKEAIIRIVGSEFTRAITRNDSRMFADTAAFLEKGVDSGTVRAFDPVRQLIAFYAWESIQKDSFAVFTIKELAKICEHRNLKTSARTIADIAKEFGLQMDNRRGAPKKDLNKIDPVELKQRTKQENRMADFKRKYTQKSTDQPLTAGYRLADILPEVQRLAPDSL